MGENLGNIIRTVTGDITPATLGVTLPHEHLNIDASGVKKDPDAKMIAPKLVAAELALYAAAGGNSLVEVTPIGSARDPLLLKELSLRTGVNVVGSTGFYFGLYLPWEAFNSSVTELEELFVTELTAGVGDTGVRAGVIGEIGLSGTSPLPAEERVFVAAARAQQRVRCGITTHTQFGRDATVQLDLLEANGADLSKVALGHMDLYPDVAYHKELALRGVFLGYDNIGRTDYRPDSDRVKLVLAMLEAGFGDQLLLSHDVSRISHLSAARGHGYAHLLKNFVPMLKAAGVPQSTVDQLLTKNPKRLLTMPAT